MKNETDIAYSDGLAVEQRIVDILHEATDLGSTTPIGKAEYSRWATRYHLCPERGNLLRHLNFNGLDVLELGAGMGGVSRVLAESARRLVSVEGTAQRIEALRQRLRDLKNWEALVGNVQDLKLDDKFDVVVVVGVLEYSELFVESQDGKTPFDVFLAKAVSFLRPEGVLVLAIENKMGLKYFSGNVEDHTNRPFDGICGYSGAKTPRTFSKKELTRMLQAQGLETVKHYFPFPDYKIPQTVLTETMLDTSAGLSADLASHIYPSSYDFEAMPLYPYRLTVQSVAQAGLLGELSNSLLMVASTPDSKILAGMTTRETAGEVAWHYSGSGRKAATCTAFRHVEGQILVDKRLHGDETLPEGDVRWVETKPERAAEGEKLLTSLLRHLYFDRTEQFYATFEQFLRWSIEKWKVGDAADGIKLDGKAFDAVVTNAARNESGFVLFDLEWESEASLGASWFILRNVLNLIADRDIQLTGLPTKNGAALYERLCESLQVKPDMPAAVQREAAVQARLTQFSEGHIRALYARLYSSFPRMYPREAGAMQWSTTAAVHEIKRVVKRGLKKYPAVRSLHGLAKSLREFLARGEASITR